jgi:hypothetical protein
VGGEANTTQHWRFAGGGGRACNGGEEPAKAPSRKVMGGLLEILTQSIRRYGYGKECRPRVDDAGKKTPRPTTAKSPNFHPRESPDWQESGWMQHGLSPNNTSSDEVNVAKKMEELTVMMTTQE